MSEALGLGIDPDVLLPMTALKHLAAGDPLETVFNEEPVRTWQREFTRLSLARFLEKHRRDR
jgi:hypothetical protein